MKKHWTFVYQIGDSWPPKFVKIEDRWKINDNVLACIGYDEPSVRRVMIPSLDEMPAIPVAEAESRGELPPE